MSLTVTAEEADKSREKRMQSQMLLESYLKNAAALTRGLSVREAKKELTNAVKGIPASRLGQMDVTDIENKRRDIMDAAKTYGRKAAFNYAFDSRIMQDQHDQAPGFGKAAHVLAAGIVAGAAWGAGSLVGLANEKAGAVVTGYIAANYVVRMGTAYLSRAKTEGEKKKFDEYAELRHAALALKKLKKAVSAQKAFDAREEQRPTLTTILAKTPAGR